jgi:hypothetical protein
MTTPARGVTLNMNQTAMLTSERQSCSSTPITKSISDRLAVRLYRDSRPKFLEISPLHKGIALLFDNIELIGEGVGFGVPVVKYGDKTFFSTSAECTIKENEGGCTLTKSFILDAVSRKRVGKASYFNDDFYRFFRKLFERAYLCQKGYAPFFNRIMELRETMRLQTDFVRVTPRGTVTFNYSIQVGSIKIRTDLSRLELNGCEEILILNEQGATFFNKYSDSDGTTLFNEQIGAWQPVTANEASLSDAGENLTFTLTKNSGTLFRGFEKVRRRFSWAGLSYSLPPQSSTFDYVIGLRTC